MELKVILIIQQFKIDFILYILKIQYVFTYHLFYLVFKDLTCCCCWCFCCFFLYIKIYTILGTLLL